MKILPFIIAVLGVSELFLRQTRTYTNANSEDPKLKNLYRNQISKYQPNGNIHGF